MAAAELSPVVTVDWLKENLNKEDVRVLDASWFLPNAGNILCLRQEARTPLFLQSLAL
jgi:3-mercaptopyruvate sulfurtransferase SseA